MGIGNKRKDLIIITLIVHDVRKHGSEESQYTITEHPTAAKEVVFATGEIYNYLGSE